MSETSNLLYEMSERLFARELGESKMRSARAGAWPEGAWRAALDQGLILALVQGEQGFGVPISDGLSLVRLLGRLAVPLPLAETMIANAALAKAGLPVSGGVVGIVPQQEGVTIRREGSGWSASGEAERVAWGRHADALLIESDGQIGLLTSHFRTGREGTNMAAQPRDQIIFDGPVSVAPAPRPSLLEAGALVRALAMAGALETLVALTVDHVSQRRQFGRPLSAFQAVQHGLARLASEAAAASAAADLAADSYASDSNHLGLAIAAARTRIGEAAGTAVGIAHQLHGAIGFTEEHRLHWFTTALWAWRDEFGSTASWTRRLGAEALGWPAPSYWPNVTAV